MCFYSYDNRSVCYINVLHCLLVWKHTQGSGCFWKAGCDRGDKAAGYSLDCCTVSVRFAEHNVWTPLMDWMYKSKTPKVQQQQLQSQLLEWWMVWMRENLIVSPHDKFGAAFVFLIYVQSVCLQRLWTVQTLFFFFTSQRSLWGQMIKLMSHSPLQRCGK